MHQSPALFVLLLMAAAAANWSCFFLVTDARQLEPAHAAGGSCIGRERDALLALKQDISYDPEDYLGSWQSGRQDCCRWAGIMCSNTTGHVIQLDLGGTHLVGQISPSLLSLEQLEYLSLDYTVLTGPNGGVPEFFGSFKNLRHLDLSYMGLVGTLPPQLGNLSKLEYLDLSFTNFNCTIPPQLGNLSKLEYLDLSSSRRMYSTDISWLTRLPLLLHLDMSGANLSSIVDWALVVNIISSLEYLRLSGCSLSSANRSLTHLNLTNLQYLDLSTNNFGHPIASAWFWNVTSITELYLTETSLYGPFPNSLGNMTSLRVLCFGCELASLRELSLGSDPEYVYQATITCNAATMTVDLTNLCDLETLWLDASLSSGNITKFIENLPHCPSNRLKYLSLKSNNMIGIMADRLGQLTSLTMLCLSYNNITGSIPLSIGNLSNLGFLDFSNNHLTTIPQELANCTSLKNIHLSNNNLIGPIPLGIGSCTRLEYLDLSYNSIIGAIPLGLGKCTRLDSIDLSNNHLTGPIPLEIASVVSAPVGSSASAVRQSPLEKQAEFFEVAVHPLHEAVASLHGWMLAIGGFLERAKAVLGRLSRTPADPLVPPDVGKVGTSGAGLHGCFSPRARVCSEIKAPVMQIMPELLELCGGVLTLPPVEEVRPDSREFSDVVSPPCQALASEKCGVADAAVSPSPESGRQAVPFGDGVAKSGLLPTVPGAVVAREVCDFLATLVVAYPGSAVG
ncbi:putative leucine-rich repeat receptor-like serine/threonine-protein kinase At2g24130 [Lolium rigidum]|uniref:putative leucine-rich repeat receptor-like serine/threonine-protein kinase At2g24130 n=1 Tax=Lolium rigidum TaxID=89674 RepID=UPI001F5CC775|nr:putative leucine-rich repeat receptor-like serine/threonine-protein kinase At2g24130 [Lolium rigidum]